MHRAAAKGEMHQTPPIPRWEGMLQGGKELRSIPLHRRGILLSCYYALPFSICGLKSFLSPYKHQEASAFKEEGEAKAPRAPASTGSPAPKHIPTHCFLA